MKIENIRTLAGANVYSHQPMLVMRLDLEELTERESHEFGEFNPRLLELLPGLAEHHCGLGRPGGFVERLHEGTYFGHIVEHVALELMGLAGVGANHGKTRYAGTPGVYNVAVEYKAEQAARFLLERAVETVEKILRGEPVCLDETVAEAVQIAEDTELGPSGRAIVEAAERRGIPWTRESANSSLVQLGYGKNLRLAQSAMTDGTSEIGVELAGDKNETNERLRKFSIAAPRGIVARDRAEALAAFAELGAPVVVKPLDGQQGKGVSLNLSTDAEVLTAFYAAQEFSPLVLLEKMLFGNNYRVLVVNGKMVAAAERKPCGVTGDGAASIEELIERENQNPLRGDNHSKPLSKIRVDAILLHTLGKNGWDLAYVPRAGETVILRDGMNLSTGGTARDVTDRVHRTVKSNCERAARVVGLDICGVDLVLPDISQPLDGAGGIIELNAAPGLRMHVFPSEGEPRDVGGAIVEMLYPRGSSARIPIFSITGTNGKTTVTRMISRVLSDQNLTVGTTTTDGIYLGDEKIVAGDTTGPVSAKTVLGDRSVEVAVLETARGGIVRRGLGYDWADVGVVTNISEDHIGQDGIESVDDLIWIKSLVAERIKPGGTLVINADDPNSLKVLERDAVKRIGKNIVYFSLVPNNSIVAEHLAAGGTAYFVGDDKIIEAANGEFYPIADVAEIPVTMNGAAEFQIQNALAAVAACRAHGVEREEIAASLKKFENNTSNPGRANFYRVRDGFVMVDYGHNPEAFAAVCRMAARWDGKRKTGIIGVPGDRCDRLIRDAARVAAHGFDRIIIKEDRDTRGRARGEVARLLCETVTAESKERECSIVIDEVSAFENELKTIGENDVVVLFYDCLAPVREVLERYGAVPVAGLETVQTVKPQRASLTELMLTI